jgi:hypothetical protein
MDGSVLPLEGSFTSLFSCVLAVLTILFVVHFFTFRMKAKPIYKDPPTNDNSVLRLQSKASVR